MQRIPSISKKPLQLPVAFLQFRSFSKQKTFQKIREKNGRQLKLSREKEKKENQKTQDFEIEVPIVRLRRTYSEVCQKEKEKKSKIIYLINKNAQRKKISSESSNNFLNKQNLQIDLRKETRNNFHKTQEKQIKKVIPVKKNLKIILKSKEKPKNNTINEGSYWDSQDKQLGPWQAEIFEGPSLFQ